MKFKKGERVKIKYKLSNDNLPECGYDEDMSELEGKIVTIVDTNENEYSIAEDKGRWSWEATCFLKLKVTNWKGELQ